MTDPLIGTVIGRFRIEAVLGTGGVGVVYRATDERLGRPVALKLLGAERASDAAFRERFLQEARLLASIRHSHIVRVLEADEWQGRLYLAMDHVAGRDLGSIIDQEGPLEPARAVALLEQVADALDAAHAAGLVHRDVKPDNILVEPGPGGAETAYLTDFGLTRPVGAQLSGLTMAGEFVGTPGYVAPEQIEGTSPVDHRADVYALGCVLYNALVGDIPYPRQSTMAILWAHVWEAPPRISDDRPELADLDPVIATAMARQPADRYQTAGSLATAARRALAGLGRALDGRTPPGGLPPIPEFERTATDLVRPAGAAASSGAGSLGPGLNHALPAREVAGPAGVSERTASGNAAADRNRRGSWQRPNSALIALGVIAVAVFLVAITLGNWIGGSPTPSSPPASGQVGTCPTSQPPSLPVGASRLVTISTDLGAIVIRVDGALSPIAAGNFVALAECEFYDGVVFHRTAALEDGTPFIIQGGDPNGTGRGGPGYTIKDEPVTATYHRGTVAMARSQGVDTQGSQFFIVLDDGARPALESANTYAIFGEVVSGMEVADAILEASEGQELPADPVVMNEVTVAVAPATSPSPSATPAPGPTGGEVALKSSEDGNSSLTSSLLVTVEVIEAPTGPAATKMLLGNKPVRPDLGLAQPFQRVTSWSLAPGAAGEKTVFIWFGTEEGAWSASPVTASIIFDRPPQAIHGVFDRTDACRSIKKKGYVLVPILPKLASDPDDGDELVVTRAWSGDIDFNIVRGGTAVKIFITPRSDFNFGSFKDHFRVEDKFGLHAKNTFELRVGPCP